MKFAIMRKRASALLISSLFLLPFLGCNSYEIVQTNHFANDDGAILRVDYGRAEKDHINKFVSPANGREFEFKSKLVVDVRLPDWPDGVKLKKGEEPPYDGEKFTAWQCMNFRGGGTMYKTDDEEWYFLASGFTCKIARKDARFTSGYRDVFGGVLCNTPEQAPAKDSRWHKIRPEQHSKKKE